MTLVGTGSFIVGSNLIEIDTNTKSNAHADVKTIQTLYCDSTQQLYPLNHDVARLLNMKGFQQSFATMIASIYMAKTKQITPGGVAEYIQNSPARAQEKLQTIRSVITQVAPGAIETISYFQIPGYSYDGYDYNGMFVWFSYKDPFVRLHIIPPVIDDHSKELKTYTTTKSVVRFPVDSELPIDLIKELVKASIKVMKEKTK